MSKPSDAPSYDSYKGGQYARVVIDRKSIHLGKYGSKKSYVKYKRLIAEWSRGTTESVADSVTDGLTVAEVLEAYRTWAERHYGDFPRSRYRNLLPVIRTVRALCADLPSHQFTPKKLKTVRQAFIDNGNCRGTVNDYTRTVVAIFGWAAEEELVPGSLVVLSFIPPDNNPPYLVSTGESKDETEIDFFMAGHHSPCQVKHLIPMETARKAVRVFVEYGALLCDARWSEV